MYVPTQMFLTRGVGIHREKLASFEMALRNAGIAPYNIVEVSSIFPPGCEMISREAGMAALTPGQIVHAVLSRCETDEPYRHIAAAVGVARPADPAMYGYLSEHHACGQSEADAGRYAEELAAMMLATILGVPFDPEDPHDEQRKNWRISGEMPEVYSIAQGAVGDEEGRWTTVVTASVLIP